jgi:uncharacterized repeat protein (TIGR03803 family)
MFSLGSTQTLNAQIVHQATEKTLHSFTGGSATGDGFYPTTGLVRDAKGNLYGTTSNGGFDVCNVACGGGTIFKISRAGRESILLPFITLSTGYFPNDLTIDGAGNLYGTTFNGGDVYSSGYIFKVDPSGNETDLFMFNFDNGTGRFPASGLVRDDAGNLYGTTTQGAWAIGAGTVFKVDAAGNFATLYQFTGGMDGGAPNRSRLLLDPSGNLYGLASVGGNLQCDGGNAFQGCGVVFEVTPSGSETVLYTFQGGTDGIGPIGDLVQDSSGNLYGVTQYGGAHGNGIVFRLSDTGQLTVLYSFHSGLDGRPMSGVILDSAGNLYGTTTMGGTYHRGSVFKLDPAGRRTELHSFTGGPDGGRPWGTLLLDGQGHLYGTTNDGGKEQQGTVFEIIP